MAEPFTGVRKHGMIISDHCSQHYSVENPIFVILYYLLTNPQHPDIPIKECPEVANLFYL